MTSPVVAVAGGNICMYDLAGLSSGPHWITMTTIAVNDPVWGTQESKKSSVLVFTAPGTPAANYQGLWWNSPAGSESGWGINITHQGDTLFVTWFTYDSGGNRTMAGYATTTGNEMTSGGGFTYTYDSGGNTSGKTEQSSGKYWNYTWDFRNRLTGVT